LYADPKCCAGRQREEIRVEDARALFSNGVRGISIALLVAAILCVLVQSGSDAREIAPQQIGDRSSRPDYPFKRSEKCFMRKINNKRERRGLRRLRWDRQIGYVARRHARRMARVTSVWHDDALGDHVTRWRSLGQNTGGGYHCGTLFRRFWKSSEHRANILGRWRHVGVGAKRNHGRLYVQQVFEYRTNPGNTFGYP
jgi:uncharacterized protein YkwD